MRKGRTAPRSSPATSIDVGALAEEFFGLGIDPYPRKPDAKLAAEDGGRAASRPEGPLQEKLRQLKRKD